MPQLIFATQNKHKIEEVQAAVGPQLELLSLSDLGIHTEIPEPFDSLEGNALEKARVIYNQTGLPVFSEDTGLEVEELGGEPGVKSARYAGEEKNFEQNIDKLLFRMLNNGNRRARFRTVIALIWKKREYLFEGECRGEILKSRRGPLGFGYDPVFRPDGSALSFGEMSLEEKNQYSHRRKAADKLVIFLRDQASASKTSNFQ